MSFVGEWMEFRGSSKTPGGSVTTVTAALSISGCSCCLLLACSSISRAATWPSCLTGTSDRGWSRRELREDTTGETGEERDTGGRWRAGIFSLVFLWAEDLNQHRSGGSGSLSAPFERRLNSSHFSKREKLEFRRWTVVFFCLVGKQVLKYFPSWHFLVIYQQAAGPSWSYRAVRLTPPELWRGLRRQDGRRLAG